MRRGAAWAATILSAIILLASPTLFALGIWTGDVRFGETGALALVSGMAFLAASAGWVTYEEDRK